MLTIFSKLTLQDSKIPLKKLTNPVPGLKTLGGYKADSAFHPSKVDQMSTRDSWGLGGKK